MEVNPKRNMQEARDSFYYEEEEDTETETLSLCDLPNYTNPADWNYFLREDQRSSSEEEDDYKDNKDEDDTCFEFFSEEYRSGTPSNTAKNVVVFCGKFIPCKQQPIRPEAVDQQPHGKKRGGLYRWKSDSSLYKPKASSKPDHDIYSNSKHFWNYKSLSMPTPEKRGYNHKGEKFRWYLIMFGCQTKMDLGDIRRRQSRQDQPSTLFASTDGVEKDGVATSRTARNGKGVGWLVRALSCGSPAMLDQDFN